MNYLPIKAIVVLFGLMEGRLAAAAPTASATDIDAMYQATHAEAIVTLHNDQDREVKVLGGLPARASDRVIESPVNLPAHGTAYAKVEIASERDLGETMHSFTFDLDDSVSPKLRVRVKAFVFSVLDDGSPEIDLGSVSTLGSIKSKEIELSSREVENFKVTSVLESPDFIEAKVLDDNRVAVIPKLSAEWGVHQGMMKVGLNSKLQPEAWVKVSADIHGQIVPSPNPLDMGVVRNDVEHTLISELKSADNKAIRLGELSVSGIKARVSSRTCEDKSVGCVDVLVAVRTEQPAGLMLGKVTVGLPDFGRTLTLDVRGVMLDRNTKIIPLNDQSAANAQTDDASRTSRQSSGVDLKSALTESIRSRAASEPIELPGKGPLLKWQAANETAIHGYLIYRSNTENGQFRRINAEMMPVSKDAGAGISSTYQYRDNTAESGKIYWYYIGMIYNDGHKQQLSGPQKVIAK